MCTHICMPSRQLGWKVNSVLYGKGTLNLEAGQSGARDTEGQGQELLPGERPRQVPHLCDRGAR